MTQSFSAAAGHASTRPPTPSDDQTQGYDTRTLWNAPEGLYASQRSLPGQAVWVPLGLPRDVLPGDVILDSGAPVAMAFGLRRLRRAYTDNACLDVLRGEDGMTATIGFDANGRLDLSAMNAFLRQQPALVTKWYDQSGQGQHLTQPNPLNCPRIDLRNRIGNGPSLAFDSQITGMQEGNGRPLYDAAKTLHFPAGLEIDGHNASVVFAGRARTASRPAIWFSLASSLPAPAIIAFCLASHYPPTGNVPAQASLTACWDAQGFFAPSGHFASQSAFVAAISFTPDNVILVAEDSFASWPAQPAGILGGYAGGSLGGTGQGESGYIELSEILFYRHYLTSHDLQTVRGALYAGLNLFPQTRDVVVFDGDSITEGYCEADAANRSFPRQLESLLHHPCRIYNTGFSGDTLAGRARAYPTLGERIYNAQAPINILHIAGGSNDIAYNDSLETIQNSLQRLCALARKTGFHVIVATVLTRGDFAGTTINLGKEAIRIAYNAWLRQAWPLFAHGIADWAADPDMGDGSFPHNTTLCLDSIHPTSLGYTYLAQISAAAVNALLLLGVCVPRGGAATT